MRVPIPLKVRIKKESNDTFEEAQIQDISWGGVLLNQNELPAIGTRLLVEFDMPDQAVTVEIWGKVVRVNKDNQGKVDGVGVEFDELDHETRSQIQGLVDFMVNAQFSKK